jgi:hypothetical protein
MQLQKESRLISLKDKDKFNPRTGHEGPEGSRGIAVFFL